MGWGFELRFWDYGIFCIFADKDKKMRYFVKKNLTI